MPADDVELALSRTYHVCVYDVCASLCSMQVSSWIDGALSANGSVLVHCHEGKSRSVALLMAYLMISKGLTLANAFQHLRSAQWTAAHS
jgi:protein-tyrosine phosphatase